jgi:DNA integrity scanning protein DisA with diadenylate cyclase activity
MRVQTFNLDREEHQETRELVMSAFSLARSLGIKTLLVQAGEISDVRLVKGLRSDERVIWIARDRTQIPQFDRSKDIVLDMPDAALNRLSQLNLALFLAALNRHFGLEERVLGLSGVTGSNRLDTLIIAKPARDYPWLQHHRSEVAFTRHLAKLLEIALRLAREGREGSAIGTIFVLGDVKELSPYLRQLILNPLKGHTQAARSIHNPEVVETLREFSALDGAFVVNRHGVVDSACTYLNAPVGVGRLSPGLGSRHASALAVTTVTDATAVVISSSSGTVSVFDQGQTVLELERTLSRADDQLLQTVKRKREQAEKHV